MLDMDVCKYLHITQPPLKTGPFQQLEMFRPFKYPTSLLFRSPLCFTVHFFSGNLQILLRLRSKWNIWNDVVFGSGHVFNFRKNPKGRRHRMHLYVVEEQQQLCKQSDSNPNWKHITLQMSILKWRVYSKHSIFGRVRQVIGCYVR